MRLGINMSYTLQARRGRSMSALPPLSLSKGGSAFSSMAHVSWHLATGSN